MPARGPNMSSAVIDARRVLSAAAVEVPLPLSARVDRVGAGETSRRIFGT